MIRGLYKQPGGKLVGVSVRLSHARRMEDTHAVECHIDGDFFLDGDEDDTWRMLRSMETALERCASEHAGNPTAMQDAAAIAIEKTMLDHPDARIVGMDAQGIAIRVGHHCAQPVHRHFGVYASNRASSGIYNSVEDAQALIEALGKVRPFFGVE